jgi:hypothetical protein
MKTLPKILKSLGAAAAVCFALSVNAQNIVNDSGFELSPAPNFSASWTLNPPGGGGAGQQFSNVGNDPSFAHSGNNHANLAPAIGSIGSLSQVLTTTTGTAYAVSFWLANNSSVPVNFFQVYINGVLLTTSMTGTITSPPFSNSGVYQQVFATFIATGTSSTLEFRYRHDDDFWRLDDVVVQRAPEGGAPLWLALSILGGLCLVHFRIRRVETLS